MKTMKKVTALLLALMMVLSLAACGGKTDNGGKDAPAAVAMTAQEVLDALKEKPGDSYGCALAEDESRMTGYYQLDMSKIDSWAAESSENSALDPSTADVLKVKAGYAQDAAALLQTGYQQVLDYCRMYSMNVAQVEQARLFVSGDYVALLILGQGPDDSTADEAKLAQDEAAKVDAAWQDIFGSAANQLAVKQALTVGQGRASAPRHMKKTAAGQIPSCNLPRHVVQ